MKLWEPQISHSDYKIFNNTVRNLNYRISSNGCCCLHNEHSENLRNHNLIIKFVTTQWGIWITVLVVTDVSVILSTRLVPVISLGKWRKGKYWRLEEITKVNFGIMSHKVCLMNEWNRRILFQWTWKCHCIWVLNVRLPEDVSILCNTILTELYFPRINYVIMQIFQQ
jgi:hypothetical protein